MGGPKSLYKESDELLLIILKAPLVFSSFSVSKVPLVCPHLSS